jgi:mRNA interferase RelE/StbE
MNGRYTFILAPRAKRDLDRFKGKTLRRIHAAIREIANDPRGPGIKKLAGISGYSKKCGRNYRILYEIDDLTHKVVIDRIGDRKDIYKG